jgi:hypothetical protein
MSQTTYQNAYQNEQMRDGYNLVSCQLPRLLLVEEPRVPVVERNAVVFIVVQNFRLFLVLAATKLKFEKC